MIITTVMSVIFNRNSRNPGNVCATRDSETGLLYLKTTVLNTVGLFFFFFFCHKQSRHSKSTVWLPWLPAHSRSDKKLAELSGKLSFLSCVFVLQCYLVVFLSIQDRNVDLGNYSSLLQCSSLFFVFPTVK